MSDIPIATIGKNSREELRVTLTSFKGYNLLSLRVFYQADDGKMWPGKSGLALRLDKLTELIEALQKAEAEATARGLIGGDA